MTPDEFRAVGVICVTPDNQHEPWLIFESGAISTFARHLQPNERVEARVCPYLLDVKPAELKGPLEIFRAKVADRDGTMKLIEMVNRRAMVPLSSEQLKTTFEAFWPEFAKQLEGARKLSPVPASPNQSPEAEKLDELLTAVRRRERQLAAAERRGASLSSCTTNIGGRPPNRGRTAEALLTRVKVPTHGSGRIGSTDARLRKTLDYSRMLSAMEL